jgi:hypothetical protein
MGGYNGRHTFDSFSYEKGILEKALRPDVSLRFPPWTKDKVNKLQFIANLGSKIPGRKAMLTIGAGLAIVMAILFYFK